jgi:hypothetical protein
MNKEELERLINGSNPQLVRANGEPVGTLEAKPWGKQRTDRVINAIVAYGNAEFDSSFYELEFGLGSKKAVRARDKVERARANLLKVLAEEFAPKAGW